MFEGVPKPKNPVSAEEREKWREANKEKIDAANESASQIKEVHLDGTVGKEMTPEERNEEMKNLQDTLGH